MTHTAIPEDELKVFDSLENIKVVFDVGARDDVDYLILKPKIKLHAFEPNPLFFAQLESQLEGRKNVYLNNYGLGEKEGVGLYSESSQSFMNGSGKELEIKTLDWYVKKNRIKRIDFLKIDVEGWDFKVLLGGKKAIKLCRYIQFEHWDDYKSFQKLLKKDFDLYYIGGRNYICVRKGEKKPWIPPVPQEGGLTDKNEKNRLHHI